MANVMPRVMEIATPLGEGVLLFHTMNAREEMSRLFEYHLDLLSPKEDINLDEILGKNVTITLGVADDETRQFNGYVTRFAQSGMHGRFHRYIAIVRPWFWFLTRTSDCRIFQEMTVPDIIKAVFADHPSADFKFELTSTYRKWTYCVQYRETDFNFVSRLMEQEGIGYYFRHIDGHNTLVLTDSTSKHNARPGCEMLSFIPAERLVRPDFEHVSTWELSRSIQPGVYVHDDYDFERPSVKLKTSRSSPRKYTPSDYEVFDYPGLYVQKGDGEQYATVRADELGTQFETAYATTNAHGVTVGSLLTIDSHPRADQNREYLVIAASYELSFDNYESLPEAGGSSYKCTFVTLPSSQQFRPKRLTPKPFVQGPQTAVVVGPAGEEIHTDEYGRVKVQFHWDRYGKKDQNSSCWIRVSQMWAGKGWGSVSTPRIGHEVIVDFLEGDPDQPIVIGNVHNAENKPPHTGVVSGLKSNTHKGKGFNQMTMDDTAGKEKITIHGQYDMNTTVEHDQTNTVKGKMTEDITKDTKISVLTGKLEHNVNTGTAAYYVKGAVTQKFMDIWDSKVTGKVSIKSNADIHIDSDTKITLVTGSSQLVMESSGAISLTGTKITVIGNDAVGISSAKTDVAGSSEAKFGTGNQTVATNAAKVAISGAAIASSATGTHEITGALVKIN
jgi:type VI secretion system secreted protein VgrG